MEEIWKDIKGYEGKYIISNLGNVKSLNYQNHGYEKNLIPKKNKYGYLWVSLLKNSIPKHYLIHRLVAQAFIDNPNNYPIINHKDEVPQNNKVENLEWCDFSHNVLYTLKRRPRKSGKLRKTKYSNKQLLQFSKDGKLIGKHESISTFCKINNYREWSILECCRGSRKTAYGYRWEFA